MGPVQHAEIHSCTAGIRNCNAVEMRSKTNLLGDWADRVDLERRNPCWVGKRRLQSSCLHPQALLS